MHPIRLLLCALLVAGCGAERRPGIPAKHVLLVTVAGLRADHTSAWQYQRPTTYSEIDGGLRRDGRALSLDDLCADGVVFANAYAPTGDPLASLASLLTGRSPLEVGDPRSKPLESESALASALAGHGLATAGFVTGGDSFLALSTGFDVFSNHETDMDTLGQALDWVSAHDYGDGQGVFLWVHLDTPTFPFEPRLMPGPVDRGGPVDFSKLFVDPSYEGLATGSAAFRDSSPELSADDCDHLVALYDGEVAQTNHLLQLFLDFYLYSGAPTEVWERTLLVVAGTSGMELCETGRWGDTDRLTDSVLHVPLALRHPDSLTGRRIFDDVVSLVDVPPTLLEWFGAPEPEVGSGRSLLAITDGESRQEFTERPAIACRIQEGQLRALSARDQAWRLIWNADEANPLDLFHQEDDELALDDVSAAQPAEVNELERELREWLAEQRVATGVGLAGFELR